jgi:hypothetical protein
MTYRTSQCTWTLATTQGFATSESGWKPNQGNFLIAVFPDRLSFDQLEAEQADIHQASLVFIGEIERILMPDFSGKLRPESSYVHLRDHYFSIYSINERSDAEAA